MNSPGAIAKPLSSFGSFLDVTGKVIAASARNSDSKTQEMLLRQKAGEAEALSQRAAAEERRKGRLLASRARAVNAASGGVTGDISDVLGDIKEDSEFNALSRLYEGQSEAVSLRNTAEVVATRRSNQLIANTIDIGSSLYTKYNKGKKK